MGDREELDFEDTCLDHFARRHHVRLRIIQQAVFIELYADQPVRQACAVDGRFEFAQKVRERADVVLVTVREEHRTQLLLVVSQVAEVRDDEVDSEHLFFREHQSGIDDDDVVAVFDQHHVAADFAQATKRDYTKIGFGLGHKSFSRRAGLASPATWLKALPRDPPLRWSLHGCPLLAG